jgi:hypothetical protein
MRDTPPEVEAHYRTLMMERSPAERLRMCTGMFTAARQLALANIDHSHSRLTPAERRRHLFLRFYEPDFGAPEREAILASLEEPPA